MNLSSMMYRLNVQQNQQQQQQPQQQTGQQSTSQQQQQQPQSQQQQQQVIPSHVLLQQQLAAAAAAAAASGSAAGAGATATATAAGTSNILALHVTNTNGGIGGDDKLKLLTTTHIKSEPLHEVIALTTNTAGSNNSNNNNNNNSNSRSSTISNINSNSNSNSCHNLLVATPITHVGNSSNASSKLTNATTINLVVNTSAPTTSAASTSAAAAAAAAAATTAAGGSGLTNGLVLMPSKRARLDAPEDWISTPSPGSVPSSAPPLSPSPGSQNHSYSANMSNGYASPLSAGSYDPYSPNGKTGRDDLSPSSSLNGYSANEGCDAKKSKKGPAPRLQEELCLVCGDRASGYHYNALTCEGCKGFFRRSVTKNAVYVCKFGRACEMDMYMRRKCQECRLKKCLAVGMRPECVVPENQCAMKRREKKAQKEKDKITTSPSSHPGTPDYIKKEILELMICEPPQHPTCPLLPDDILAKCQARNIPPLTYNQLAVIYKLIWYQDGYEQPSEEDLKRIMSQPDENESQNDVSFRHITEITILTVQLIVEFAKGLPAFTKIPQEDQITLLKACSSEVMMLRMARRYDQNSDSIFFANNRSYTRDSYKIAGVADNIEDLLHFCRQMYSMKVDNVEYALLTAIVIFSDRPGLDEAQLVEAIQSYYIDTLRIYILNRHCGDPMSLVFYAKLLSILTELRTLGNQNAEMCFSLKLKNRKLPKFLEEIWDVHAIPPPVQSHLQAQEEEEQRLRARMHCSSLQGDGEAGGSGSGSGSGDGDIADTSGSVASTSAAAAAQAAAAQQSSSSTSSSNNNNSGNNNNNMNSSNNNNMCDIVVSGLGSPGSPTAMSSSSSVGGGGGNGGGGGGGIGIGVNVNVGGLGVGMGSGGMGSSGVSSGLGGGIGIGGVSSTMVGGNTIIGHGNMMANNMAGIGNDFIGSVMGPTTAAATSSTSLSASVPVSSTTAAAAAAAVAAAAANGSNVVGNIAGVNVGGVGVGVGNVGVGGVVGPGGVNVCNAQTAFALLGMPLHQADQLIGGTVVKSEHSTTA